MKLQKTAEGGFFIRFFALFLALLAPLMVPAGADAADEKFFMGLQKPQSTVMRDIVFFHNDVILPIEIGICLIVLALLIYVMVRFNEKANPIPATFTHNTMVEIVWTGIPVLILIFIATFSFPLLYKEDVVPKHYDMTIKATGNQWYWDYEYPDNGDISFTANVLSQQDAKVQGKPYLLATDNPVVVPVGKVIRVEVTAPGTGVIHSWDMPAMGIKLDAIPARLNQTWFKAENIGTFYGQCSQMCGFHHAFMPIELKVVSQADFDAWVASKKSASLQPASKFAMKN